MARILVADDDRQVRLLLQMILEQAQHTVLLAADGQEAINQCREHAPDIAIIDIIMPEKEGLETIREIRQDFPDVPIIAVSGGGRIDARDYLILAKNLGADCALEKPVERDDLLAAVNGLLEQS